MSPAQDRMHWRLWAALRRAQPGADRKAVYAELSLPASHLAWKNSDLDIFKAHVLAITRADDIDAQMAGARMPATRLLVAIDRLLAQLGAGREYAAGIARAMMRGAALPPLEELPAPLLVKVRFALVAQVRRGKKEASA